MARCCHVVAPHELIGTDPPRATWTPAWRINLIRLIVWAHKYSGPIEEAPGRTTPIGAMQRPLELLPFIPVTFLYFSPCGTNPSPSFSQATWQSVVRRIKLCESKRVHLVDFGLPDRHQSMCVICIRRSH